ncbi:MAG: 3-oxoacid CoA-transferase subunit A [Tenericutes bacterium]|jgi:acetate CoA/acetoacetate CoA-transferase alpha subunit|nr:3-oxoacid CoA-transferase subunit A [Mycoplasmatota bacterium]
MNKWIDKKTFQSLIKDGQTIMFGGFLTCGTPEQLIDWIVESNVKNLTLIGNDAGYPDKGVGKLIANNQVKHLIATHIGTNPYVGKLMSENQLKVDLIPQGTLIEQIRAFGAGLGGILTPTGVHTVVEEGKQQIVIKGKTYLLEEAIGADIALVSANHADSLGNLTYAKTARNFNPIIATAAKQVIALATHRVEQIDPESVITPHIFVDYVVGGDAK